MLAQDDGLRAALGQLSGAALKGVSLGAGEIHVAFEQPDGVWGLGTGGSHWVLLQNDVLVVDDEDDDGRIGCFDGAIGRHVIAAHPGRGDAALMLELEDGWQFCIVKSPVGSAARLPVYELLSPEHRMYALQGDGVLNEIPSDVPISELLETGQLSRWPSARRTEADSSVLREWLRKSLLSYPFIRSILKRLSGDVRP